MTIQARVKVRKAVPMAGILAVAITVALVAAAFASGRLSPAARDELSRGGIVAFPANYAEPLDALAREVTILDAAVESSALGHSWARRCPAGTDSSMHAFLSRPHQWSAVRLPASIAGLVKGTQVFLLHSASPGLSAPTSGTEYWRIREMVALKGNRLYTLPGNLTTLLEDCELGFGPEDVITWTPAVAYVAVAGHRYPGSAVQSNPQANMHWDSVACGHVPLVPAFTIGKMMTDTVMTVTSGESYRLGDARMVRLVVQVAGVTDTMFIPTVRGVRGLCPDRVRWRSVVQTNRPWLGMRDEDTSDGCIVENGE